MVLSEIVEELQPKIGSEIHMGAWLAMTQERIDEFAKATGDFQWIHVDPKKAEKESPFGGSIAHGFLRLALIPFLAEMACINKQTSSQPKFQILDNEIVVTQMWVMGNYPIQFRRLTGAKFFIWIQAPGTPHQTLAA